MDHWVIEVEVALSRPPKADMTIPYLLPGEMTWPDVELLACQWAYERPGVSMPVGSLIVDWPDDPR